MYASLFGPPAPDLLRVQLSKFVRSYASVPFIEVEGKLGILRQGSTRCPPFSFDHSIILNPHRVLDDNIVFESGIPPESFRALNNELNLLCKKHPDAIQFCLSKSIDRFYNGKVRVSYDQHNRLKKSIVKQKEEHLNLSIASGSLFDIRISASIETPVPVPDGKWKFERRKTRMSYQFDFRVDMTEVVDVTSDNQAGAPNYEFEMELVDLADLATEQQDPVESALASAFYSHLHNLALVATASAPAAYARRVLPSSAASSLALEQQPQQPTSQAAPLTVLPGSGRLMANIMGGAVGEGAGGGGGATAVAAARRVTAAAAAAVTAVAAAAAGPVSRASVTSLSSSGSGSGGSGGSGSSSGSSDTAASVSTSVSASLPNVVAPADAPLSLHLKLPSKPPAVPPAVPPVVTLSVAPAAVANVFGDKKRKSAAESSSGVDQPAAKKKAPPKARAEAKGKGETKAKTEGKAVKKVRRVSDSDEEFDAAAETRVKGEAVAEAAAGGSTKPQRLRKATVAAASSDDDDKEESEL